MDWEYRTERWSGDWTDAQGIMSQGYRALNLMLAQRGREGWELVNFGHLDNIGVPGGGTVFVFKKPLT